MPPVLSAGTNRKTTEDDKTRRTENEREREIKRKAQQDEEKQLIKKVRMI